MAMLPSHAHIECILNDERLDTWADDDPPYSLEPEDSASLSAGMSGRKYGNGLPALGGRLMLRFAPHSPSVKWLIEREQERKKLLRRGTEGYAQVFRGTLKDVVTGINVKLTGGTIIKIPPFPVAGQTFEAIFEFEIIESFPESSAWSVVGEYPETS